MSLSPLPSSIGAVVDKIGRLVSDWRSWIESVNYWLRPIGQSGTTTARPVDGTQIPLYIGQTYFDTTLNKPIWVKSRNPTVWIDATGAVV